MSDKTGIEWTDATWNPVTGCTEVSPGCDHCYAKTFAERWRGVPQHHFEQGFDVVLRPERLDIPTRWRRPRRVFVNSMSDLFHDEVPDEFIAEVFGVMGTCAAHTFQVLTKRHARMRSLLSSPRFGNAVVDHQLDWMKRSPSRMQNYPGTWPLPNVWLGVSVENQQWADIRIPALLDTPAAVRFLSCEPLLGPIDLTRVRPTRAGGPLYRDALHPVLDACSGAELEPRIDWVIVGGESGRDARPMHPEWARLLRDQCVAAGVPFLFKQWGEWRPYRSGDDPHRGQLWDTGGFESLVSVIRVGKKAAGRELDGRTWDQYPERAA